MKKHGTFKLSMLNRVILTTLIAVFIIFSMLIALVTNILLSNSTKTAKSLYRNYANHIIQVVKDNMNFMAGMLDFTQQSLSLLDYGSSDADAAVDHILVALMELSPNVYSTWMGLEPGVRYPDRRYTQNFIRHDGNVIAIEEPDDLDSLDDPDIAPYYAVPLFTKFAYFDNVGLYDYGIGEGEIYTATVSVPIIKQDKVIGVCGVDYLYKGIFDQIIPNEEEAILNIMLLSWDMSILYSPDDELVLKNLSDLGFTSIDAVREVLKNADAYSSEIISPVSGLKSLISIMPLMIDTGIGRHVMYLYFDIPLNSLYSNAYNVTIIIVISSIICMLIIV
jgi:hypothetical protein